MADALCGPSNPLQSFRKHTQVDRTLQQDRLTGPRHSPAQGFRTPDPRSAIADAEFHAFENAQPNSFQFQQPEIFNPPPLFHTPPPNQGWAADFQKLQISGPPVTFQNPGHFGLPQFATQPLPVNQFRMEAPLIKTTNGGWHNEFMQQRSNTGTPIFEGKQALREPQVNGFSNKLPFMNNFAQPNFEPNYNLYQQTFLPQQEQYKQVQFQPREISDVQSEETLDNYLAELDKEFAMEKHISQHLNGIHNNEESQEIPVELQKNDIRIGSDSINYIEQKDRTQEQSNRDADELARTAGHLLNLVRHDTSEKFQNSQFLGLMRKIRDREVVVQGNELQSTGLEQNGTNKESFHNNSAVTEHQQSQLQSHDPNTFQFPDMNNVYQPESEESMRTRRYPGSWDYPPTSSTQRINQVNDNNKRILIPAHLTERDMDVNDFDHSYNIDNDQFPQTQIQALHPGGRLYPEQSPRLKRSQMMSGGVGIVAEDFDTIDENQEFATRYQKPSVASDEDSSNSA